MTGQVPPVIASLVQQRLALLEGLRAEPRGLSWCAEHTALVDKAVVAVAESIAATRGGVLPFCVVATGGYGRRELSPYSDVDLAVVPADEDPAHLDAAVKAFFRGVGEAARLLGLELGYAFLLISDAPGLDAKSRTGLLDSRLIAGPRDTYDRLAEALAESLPTGEFLLTKIRERTEAFRRYHDTPLVVEPHLKEGAGGLRCFQTASWIGMAIGRQVLSPSRDYRFLVRVRNIVHLCSGKRQDQLLHTRREEVADCFQLDPYQLTAIICQAGLELNKDYQTALASLAETRFSLTRGVIAIRGEARVLQGADAGEAAAGLAIATDLGLRVEEIDVTTADTVDAAHACYAISHGEATLRNLDHAGLLQILLPELVRCRTLIPRDNVHTFTVFEHTLRVVRALDGIEPGTFLGSIKDSLTDLQPLYLAALLHDVGKVIEEVPHSQTGEQIALAVGGRWRMRPETTALVAWLVRDHLTMAHFIRLRDLDNPETIREFAALVETQDRLDMLTLLTWADVNAVSDSTWTIAQGAFLRDLHEKTSSLLHIAPSTEPDAPAYRQRLTRQFRGEDIAEADVESFIDSLPAHYLTSTPPDLVRLHYRLAEKARAGESTVEVHSQPDVGATEFTVCCRDEPALLSKLLGVLYAFDLSMLGVRASTTRSDPPVVLDVLSASFNGRPAPAATATSVVHALHSVIEGRQDVREILASRGKDASRGQNVFTYTFVPGTPAVLEIRAPRGRGMPYRFSKLFADLGWNILAARVGQWADSGAAAFYLEGKDGQPLTEAEVTSALGTP